MTQEKLEAIGELLTAQPDFARLVFQMDAPEAVRAFGDKGVEITEEDLNELLKPMAELPQGELSEENLENVVGGAASIWWIVNQIWGKRNSPQHGGGGGSFDTPKHGGGGMSF